MKEEKATQKVQTISTQKTRQHKVGPTFLRGHRQGLQQNRAHKLRRLSTQKSRQHKVETTFLRGHEEGFQQNRTHKVRRLSTQKSRQHMAETIFFRGAPTEQNTQSTEIFNTEEKSTQNNTQKLRHPNKPDERTESKNRSWHTSVSQGSTTEDGGKNFETEDEKGTQQDENITLQCTPQNYPYESNQTGICIHTSNLHTGLKGYTFHNMMEKRWTHVAGVLTEFSRTGKSSRITVYIM